MQTLTIQVKDDFMREFMKMIDTCKSYVSTKNGCKFDCQVNKAFKEIERIF